MWFVIGDEDVAVGVDRVPASQHSQSRSSRFCLSQIDVRPVVRAQPSSRSRSENYPAPLLCQLRHKLSAVQRVWEGVPARDTPAGLVHGSAHDAMGAAYAETWKVDAGDRWCSGHRRRPAITSACPVQLRRNVWSYTARVAVQLIQSTLRFKGSLLQFFHLH